MSQDFEQTESTPLVATFLLGDGLFGVGAGQVQEVVRVGDITPVHHAPAYVVGIRNLRGRIVTVVDLAIRLGLGQVSEGPETRILIVEAHGEPIGLLVDSVADTVAIDRADVLPAPPNVNGVQAQYLSGVTRTGERLVALLALDPVLQPGTATLSA